jgi:hypothetical protein
MDGDTEESLFAGKGHSPLDPDGNENSKAADTNLDGTSLCFDTHLSYASVLIDVHLISNPSDEISVARIHHAKADNNRSRKLFVNFSLVVGVLINSLIKVLTRKSKFD